MFLLLTNFMPSHSPPPTIFPDTQCSQSVYIIRSAASESALHCFIGIPVLANTTSLARHRGDPLTWLVVDDDEELSDHGTDSYSGPSVEATPPPHHRNHHPHAHPANYARVYLSFNGRVGLGCRYVMLQYQCLINLLYFISKDHV